MVVLNLALIFTVSHQMHIMQDCKLLLMLATRIVQRDAVLIDGRPNAIDRLLQRRDSGINQLLELTTDLLRDCRCHCRCARSRYHCKPVVTGLL